MRKVLRTVLLMAVCVVLGAGGLYFYQNYCKDAKAFNSQSTTIDLTVLKQKLEDNEELSTAKYLYTDSIAITDQNDLSVLGHPEIKLPFTDATYVLQFDGVIKAGYDLGDVVPELKDDHTVVVKLPKAKVLSHETGNVEVVLDQQNIMNPLEAGQESNWIEGKKQEMEERAESLGLFDEAKQNAKATFESLYSGCLPTGAVVEVEFEENQ